MLQSAGQHVATEAEARARIVGAAGTNVQLQVRMPSFTFFTRFIESVAAP